MTDSKSHRHIVVIGCSLGGVEALPRLIAGLSPDLQASVLVVMHLFPGARDYLPEMLKTAPLPVVVARDGARIEPGSIYLAVPDRHLMIEGDRIRLSRGPRESHARPSVDVLFRSAALSAGRRVIGIVLTGQLDDGTSGLWSIKDRGGITIVQSPDDAAYPSMPRSAIQHVQVDHIVGIDEMPKLLAGLASQPLPHLEDPSMQDKSLETEVDIALEKNALAHGFRALGEQSFFTCPDCQGSMIKIQQGPIKRYRCHTGHAFSEQSLAERGIQNVERTLWTALAQLEEHHNHLEQLENSTRNHSPDEASAIACRAGDIEGLMHRVRALALDPSLRS